MPDSPGQQRVRHVVGCMTGTSLDGLDAALVRIEGTGLEMTASFLGLHSQPFDDTLRQQLLHLAEGNAAPPLDYMRAARMLGVMHAQAVGALLETHGDKVEPSRLAPEAGPTESASEFFHAARGRAPAPSRGRDGSEDVGDSAQLPGKAIDFVVAHGQTIWHAPKDTLSWQLFDPWPLVRHLGVPVCYDLRQADLIAGGEGAPITPVADKILYGALANAHIVNLGGIVNVTRWFSRDDAPVGLDLGPCNLLLDGLVQRLYPGLAFDTDGKIASSIKPSEEVWLQIAQLLPRLPVAGESLGREDYGGNLMDHICETLLVTASPDLIVSSACEWVARHIDHWLEGGQPEVVVLAGGGTRNKALVDRIRELDITSERMCLSDDLGIPCEAREAMGFAVLGALSQDGVPITLPGVTGAEHPGVAGAWVYP